MLRWLSLSIVVIILDQISKYLAESNLALYQPVPVIPSFNLTLMHNTGAAFSFLSDQGGWQRWFFVVLAVVVVAVLIVWLYRLQKDQRILAVALALVIGGAVGNVMDRIYYGYVVDFIDVYYGTLPHWPAFNLADSAIFLGVGFLLYDGLFCQQEETPKA